MAMRKEFLDAWHLDILRMQRDDQSLTARRVLKRTCSWNKALIRIKARPFQVVYLPSQGLLPSIHHTNKTSEDLRPNFFYSQYILQFEREPIQADVALLSQAVAFISDFIQEPPGSLAKDLIPTIFNWQPYIETPEGVVEFFALAKSSVGYQKKMRRYEVNELLRMRETLPFVVCNLDNLTQEGDRAGILTYPHQARNERSFSIKTKDLKRRPITRNMSSQSSADDEDRIVFRGHSTRHAQKENRQISTRISWQLCRSNNSIGDASTPLSAPSGERAQKQENFQKFYRAVVSPTHVRVTAGGRIVPNTRAPPQPVFTWNRQKSCFEGKKTMSSEGESVETIQWPQGAPLNDVQNAFHGPLPVGCLGMYGPRVRSPPLGGPALQPEFRETAPFNSELSAGKPLVDKSVTSAQPEPSVPAVEISHPAQFDLTKPFLYNGQLVYPMPRGFMPPPGAMLPLSMLGSFAHANPTLPPGLFPQQALPMYASPLGHPIPMPFQPMMLPSLAPPGQPGPHSPLPLNDVANLGSNTFGNPNVPAPSANTANPVVSAAQLQAMRLQEEGLRDYLKTLDNQLANNRHQINEAHVFAQHNFVSQQVADLESRIASAHVPTIPQNVGNKALPSNIDGDSQKPASKTIHTRSGPVTIKLPPVEKPTTARGLVIAKKTETTSAKSSGDKVNTVSKGDGVSKTSDAPKAENSTSSSNNSMRSKLSAAAARAPPFKPRNKVTEQSQVSIPILAVDTNVPRTRDVNEEDYCGWDNGPHVTVPLGIHDVAMMTIQQQQEIAQAARIQMANLASTSQLSSSFNQNLGGVANHSQQKYQPYLVGLPSSPRGFGAAGMGNEYIYPRELTEEELRARHLYWGKAPRELQKGLPKFDGKDFFPPSPTKPTHTRATSHQSSSNDWHGAVPILRCEGHLDIVSGNHSLGKHQEVSFVQSENGDPFQDKPAISFTTINARQVADGGQNERDKTSSDDDTASLDSWDLPKNDSTFPSFPTELTSSSHETMIRASPEPSQDLPGTEDANQSSFTTSGSRSTTSFLQDLLKNPRYSFGLKSPFRNPLLPVHATMAAPPSLTSTTAHGLLPNYSGLATASLAVSPSINSTPERQLRHVGALSERLLSDRPPSGLSFPIGNIPPTIPTATSWQAGSPSSTSVSNSKDAKEYLQSISVLSRDTPAFVDKNLDPNSKGTGPVRPGEDW